MRGIPTKTDINVYNNFDEQGAVSNFHGKSLEQAEELFRKNFLNYQEDLFVMGPRAFGFYVLAAIRYLQSPEANGDCDAVSSFSIGLEQRLNHPVGLLQADVYTGRSFRLAICDAIDTILSDFDRFDVDESIYGDVRSRYNALRKRIAD